MTTRTTEWTRTTTEYRRRGRGRHERAHGGLLLAFTRPEVRERDDGAGARPCPSLLSKTTRSVVSGGGMGLVPKPTTPSSLLVSTDRTISAIFKRALVGSASAR